MPTGSARRAEHADGPGPTLGYAATVIRHVVVFRWADGASEQATDAVSAGLAELPGRIPAIRAYRFGPDAGMADGNWDFAVTADFLDEAGYVEYRDHPDHRAVITGHIAPILAERAAVQVELDS